MPSTKFWKVKRGNPLHYLRIFINFCYYAAILPFRIVFDPDTATYKLKKCRVQTALTILLMSLCVCEEVINFVDTVDTIRNPSEDKKMGPMIYFEMFSMASNIVYYATVFRTVWCKSYKILAVIQHLHIAETNTRPTRRNPNVKAQIWFGISLLPFIIYPTMFISGYFISSTDDTWVKRVEHWGKNTSKVFFADSYFPGFPNAVKIVLAIARNIFLLAYTQVTTAMEILGITFAIMMSDAVADFWEIVKNAREYSSGEILKEYDLLRSLSRKVNKAIGSLTFGLTLACLPYYIENLLEFVDPDNVAVFIRHLMFFINSFGFLILAAHINKKAYILEERLLTEKDFSDMSPNQLNIFLHDLASHNIGFSGSGFFTISAGFVGTIISLLLTFSIIIIQFESSNFVIPATSR